MICLARGELLERRRGWGWGRRNATQLFLEPLTTEHSRELVAALLPSLRKAGEDGSPGDEVIAMVAERSGGNPLFAEEMVRRLAEDTTAADELPDTVQAVLAARLDALDPFERRLVQQAVVVGRTFWEGSLSELAKEEGRSLSQTLATLQEKDILAAGAEGLLADERELAYKHVLIRDVAYGMLPKAVRCRRHFEVGRFLEERAGDRSDEVVSLLAEHYGRAAALGAEADVEPEELARITERGVRALEDAGDAAALLYANREAASHFEHALALLGPDNSGEAARIGEAGRRRAARRAGGYRHPSLGRVPRAPSPRREPRSHSRPPPKARRGSGRQGGTRDRDRELSARDQPAEGRTAPTGARAAVRGGSLALPADGQQHARHLRLREGAAAGGAARRDTRGQPRARDLRTRLRAARQGTLEPSALGGADARIGPLRDDPRAARPRPPPGALGGGRAKRGRRVPRGPGACRGGR